jgi:conjugative transfer signal peptidase TraF
MTPSHKDHVRGRAFAFIALKAAIAVWGIAAAVHLLGLRFNTTPSLPMGFWLVKPVRIPLARGMIVSFCFPCSVRQRRTSDGIAAAIDRCPDGGPPLLKPIIAVPGDVIGLDDRGLAINGIPVPGSARLPYAPSDRIPSGEYAVPSGQFWAVSTLHPRSFDSRYFGAVSVECTQGEAFELLTRR